jgi:hypothetical protein
VSGLYVRALLPWFLVIAFFLAITLVAVKLIPVSRVAAH